MKFKIATNAVLLLSLMCATHAQRKATSTIPASVYGTWEIYKFEEVGGHGRENRELAQKEIGQKITFGRKAVRYDKDFLFFDPQCPRVSYTFEVHVLARNEISEKGTLDFYGLNPVKEGQIQNVVLRCNGRPQYYFELAAGDQLAIYYDGWFFFLKQGRK
ncbi:MAG TPA: hypothetical protein VE980_17060 [Pyrinomonadaceae bacterium]|nr:hypothetical protein [Pyrinomonadaceae bacterium]